MRYETLQDFIEHHLTLGHRITTYVDEPKRNYVQIGVSRTGIDRRNGYWLRAESPYARIELATATAKVWSELGDHVKPPFHMVTFTSRRYAFAESDARNFDREAHQAEVTKILGGHNFIGMTEVAYYPRWRIARGGNVGPIVSWHSHVITMESSRSEIEADTAEGAQEESLLPNVPAVHIVGIGRTRVLPKLLYMEKQPHRQYTPHSLRTPRERIDRNTGEVMMQTHKQSKFDMRPGQLVRMVNALGGQYLDEMLFGNGLGEELATFIKDDARKRLNDEEQRERERREGAKQRAEAHREVMESLQRERQRDARARSHRQPRSAT